MTTRVINFDRAHHEAVASGAKRRTIRRVRKGGNPAPGDTLRLWGGLRTRNARLLAEAECLSATPCHIETAVPADLVSVSVDGAPVPDLDAFARLDGFDTPADMARFWIRIHGPGPWSGILIEW